MAAATSAAYENELKVMKATELRLGLPGTDSNFNNKRPISLVEQTDQPPALTPKSDQQTTPPPSKAQIVGWPPIRSYRKNNMMKLKSSEYVKVSMDGAPYLRKIDLNNYNGYPELLKALEEMFKFTINGQYCEREGYRGSDYAPTYEDKDGDWMLVGDVPWEMFINSCKRLRIMKGAAGTSSELPISSAGHLLLSRHHTINQAR